MKAAILSLFAVLVSGTVHATCADLIPADPAGYFQCVQETGAGKHFLSTACSELISSPVDYFQCVQETGAGKHFVSTACSELISSPVDYFQCVQETGAAK